MLERNPDYFQKDHVFLDRVVFQIVPDSGARQVALERGDVDHIPYFALAAVRRRAAVSAYAASRSSNSVRPALGEIIMFFNLRHAQLGKKEVRQAIAHAIDRNVLVKLALNGRARVATGPIRSDNPPFYNPDVPKYPRDVARANRLLDKAGAPRRGASRFAVRLSYEGAGEGGALQSAAEIMREQLREVGIDLQLRPSDPAAWVDTAFIKWDFDMTMGSFGTGPDPKIAVSRLYKTENIQRIPSANLMGYSNPKVDDLLSRADLDLNQDTRARLYKEAQSIMVDELPALWLWEKFYPIANRDGLVGLPSGAMHSEGFLNVGWVK